MLTRTLDFARKHGRVDGDPAKDAIRPKPTRKKLFVPIEKDVRSLIKSVTARDPELADLATVPASTDMRTGEAMGLQMGRLVPNEIHMAAAIID